MKSLKDNLKKVEAKDLKPGHVILTIDEEKNESVEQVNCVDNEVVWMEDINGEDHPENVKDMDSYYEIYLLKTQD